MMDGLEGEVSRPTTWADIAALDNAARRAAELAAERRERIDLYLLRSYVEPPIELDSSIPEAIEEHGE
jgi:hypothetical protein